MTNIPYISNFPFKIGEGANTPEFTVSQMRDFHEHLFECHDTRYYEHEHLFQ